MFCIVNPALMTRRGVDIRLNLDFRFLYNNKGVVMDNRTISAGRRPSQSGPKSNLRAAGLSILALTIGLTAPGVVHAQSTAADTAPQSAEGTNASDIVVTARYAKEKLVDVPISMQAFTASQIAADKIITLDNLQFQAGFTFQQGVSTQGGGREFPSLIFRGMQTTYGAGSGDSGSLFIDGVYVSGGAASVTTADVAQIEVLKGPQNVYFGKNTFGGAINFITANPKDTFGGSFQASESGLGSSDDVLSVEGPLVKGILDARLTFEDYTKGAQYHSNDGGDLGKENSKSVTATLYFTPSPNLWIKFRGHYQQDDDSTPDTGFLPGSTLGSNCPAGSGRATTASGAPFPITLAAPYFCGSIPSLGQVGTSVLNQTTVVPQALLTSLATNQFGPAGGPYASDPFLSKVPSLDHSGLRRNLYSFGLQGAYTFSNNWKLSINSGYNQATSLDIWDLDRGPAGLYENAQPIISKDWSVEARLTSDPNKAIRGVVGASYFHSLYQSTQYDDNFFDPNTAGFLYTCCYAGTSIQSGNLQNETDKTYAVFASVDVDIMPWLTATAEGRYQHEKFSDVLSNNSQISEGFNSFLPRAIVKLHPQKDWNFYASYSQGVQPAVLNTSYALASPAAQTYLQSVVPGANDYAPQAKLIAWEVGAKQSLFDNRITYGIALYYDRWKNQQTSTAIFDAPNCTYAEDGTNAACPLPSYGASIYENNQAKIYGVEFQGSALITPKWTADVSANYTHARWLSYQNNTYAFFTGGASYYNGNTISRVPEWQGALSTTYKDHLSGDWNWYTHWNVNYTGSMYESEINLAKTKAYARVNASIGVTTGKLTIEFYAVNLFNDKNWDWASRVPELQSLSDCCSYNQYMGLLVQAPDRQDFGIRLTGKF